MKKIVLFTETDLFEFLLQIGRFLQRRLKIFLHKVVAGAFDTFYEPHKATFLMVQQLNETHFSCSFNNHDQQSID